MGMKDHMKTSLTRTGSALVSMILRRIRKIPFVRKRVEKEYAGIMGELERVIRPYKDDFTTCETLPDTGLSRRKILSEMQSIKSREEAKWKDGFASGAVYHGDQGHIDFLNKVYAINSQSNPLHSDLWPSASKFESEIVSMTAHMLGAGQTSTSEEICGVVSSGGTESILLAIKTYRDRARAERNITKPEMIIPVTAHAAFDKAAQYFNIKIVRIPVDSLFRADVVAARKAVTKNTIVIVGSAPTFPHGAVDPIEELSELARSRGIGFHTDACLGGFILPWAKKLGYPVPAFDFSLPGVTSISADTHKYGYAAKGTSVILYRGTDLLHYQYFTITDWPGGLYFSPTFAGSRPGALSAACWAAMVSMGEQGYLETTERIMETAQKIKEGIKEIEGLTIFGDPLWVIAFGSDTLNIYKVMDFMTKRGWSLNGLHKPSCVHLCVTLRHTEEGVGERFIEDLTSAVEYVNAHPLDKGDMAPVYGMAATMPDRSIVGELLQRYIDMLYKV